MCVEVIASAVVTQLFRKDHFFENYTDAFRLVENGNISHQSKH